MSPFYNNNKANPPHPSTSSLSPRQPLIVSCGREGRNFTVLMSLSTCSEGPADCVYGLDKISVCNKRSPTHKISSHHSNFLINFSRKNIKFSFNN